MNTTYNKSTTIIIMIIILLREHLPTHKHQDTITDKLRQDTTEMCTAVGHHWITLYYNKGSVL